MQFKVPQNIDLEDKIVGPLTLLQFVYLMAGGLIIYIAMGIIHSGWFWLVAIPVGIFSLALAFLKIQDQPFMHFLASAALYFVRPRERAWKKEDVFERPHVFKKAVVKKDEKVGPKRHIVKSELDKLAFVLDTKGKVEKKVNNS